MAKVISAESALKFGWRTFKSRPSIFVGSIIIYAAVQGALMLIEGVLPEILTFIISLAVGTLLAIGFMSFYLKAHDEPTSVTFKHLWNPKPFWWYLITSLVMGAIVVLGFLALIVPGILFAIAFSMAPYLVVDKRLSTFAALKKSWYMTKGNWLPLLILGIILTVANFIGALLLMVGLLITAPISALAMTHVYKTLSKHHA